MGERTSEQHISSWLWTQGREVYAEKLPAPPGRVLTINEVGESGGRPRVPVLT